MPAGSEWWKTSWNWVHGCTPRLRGCKFCYAERMARRFAGRVGYPAAPDHFRVTVEESKIAAPMRRKKPTVYFAPSMGDPFHAEIPTHVIRRVLAVVAACPQHQVIMLTKRPERAREILNKLADDTSELWEHGESLGICLDCGAIDGWSDRISARQPCSHSCGGTMVQAHFPLRNLWLGVTAENNAMLAERGRILVGTVAAHRVLSMEPLLGEINAVTLAHILFPKDDTRGVRTTGTPCTPDWRQAPSIDWVIVGGETGSPRVTSVDAVRTIRDVCKQAGVPVWFKVWGRGKAPGDDREDTVDGELIREAPGGIANV